MEKRVAIVTGGAKGIGLACVRRFLDDGYHVVIADMDENAGQVALSEFDTTADRVRYFDCDVADKLSVHNLIADTLGEFGQIDVLINNAGIAEKGGITDIDIDTFDRVLAVNLRGAFLVAKAVVAHMLEEIENREDRSRLSERPYSIINMSSINDEVSLPDYLAYTISKGGLRQMTKSMAIELAPLGIRVNAIGPGSVKTEMLTRVINKEAMNKIVSRTPLGRPALPEEIASVAAFLASNDASYITGQVIYVDGGRMALNYTMPIPDEG